MKRFCENVLDNISQLWNTFLVALAFIVVVVILFGIGGIGIAVVCFVFGITYIKLTVVLIILALLITIGLHSYDEVQWKLKHRKRKVA